MKQLAPPEVARKNDEQKHVQWKYVERKYVARKYVERTYVQWKCARKCQLKLNESLIVWNRGSDAARDTGSGIGRPIKTYKGLNGF